MEKENNTITIEIDLDSLNIINTALHLLKNKISNEIELLEESNCYNLLASTRELLEAYSEQYKRATKAKDIIGSKLLKCLINK